MRPLEKRNVRFIYLLTYLTLIVSAGSLQAQDFKNSIASSDFDFITKDDPSTFEKLVFVGQGQSEMPDKRNNGGLWRDAYRFTASFSDHTKVDLFVDSKDKDRSAARHEAMRYVDPLGKLPTALRQGVDRLCIHWGGKTTTAFSDQGLIVIYADNASVRISNHDLEETIFHESVHAAWDAKHAKSDRWKRAQSLDGGFATLYAKSKPDQEDLAETALFAFTIIHHPQRLPQSVRTQLETTVGNRILYVEQLIPLGKPIHYPVQRSETADP